MFNICFRYIVFPRDNEQMLFTYVVLWNIQVERYSDTQSVKDFAKVSCLS